MRKKEIQTRITTSKEIYRQHTERDTTEDGVKINHHPPSSSHLHVAVKLFILVVHPHIPPHTTDTHNNNAQQRTTQQPNKQSKQASKQATNQPTNQPTKEANQTNNLLPPTKIKNPKSNIKTTGGPNEPTGPTFSGGFEIHVLNVGQGDSQLIVFPSGYSILVDVRESHYLSTLEGGREVVCLVGWLVG